MSVYLKNWQIIASEFLVLFIPLVTLWPALYSLKKKKQNEKTKTEDAENKKEKRKRNKTRKNGDAFLSEWP